MSRSKFHSKFKNDLKKLTSAVEGNIALDTDNPKLYQKLIRFYEDQGVQLYNDPEDDYNVILDQVEADLIESGVYAWLSRTDTKSALVESIMTQHLGTV